MNGPMERGRDLLPFRRMTTRLGVPRGQLRDRAVAGDLPALLAGNRWMFRPDIVSPIVAAMASKGSAE